MKSMIAPGPSISLLVTAYTSVRLQVETMTASATLGDIVSRVSADACTFAGNVSFSRMSTGAVLWLSPTSVRCMLLQLALPRLEDRNALAGAVRVVQASRPGEGDILELYD